MIVLLTDIGVKIFQLNTVLKHQGANICGLKESVFFLKNHGIVQVSAGIVHIMFEHFYIFYSRTSMARTLMVRLPRLSRTRSCVPRKIPIAANLR